MGRLNFGTLFEAHGDVHKSIKPIVIDYVPPSPSEKQELLDKLLHQMREKEPAEDILLQALTTIGALTGEHAWLKDMLLLWHNRYGEEQFTIDTVPFVEEDGEAEAIANTPVMQTPKHTIESEMLIYYPYTMTDNAIAIENNEDRNLTTIISVDTILPYPYDEALEDMKRHYKFEVERDNDSIVFIFENGIKKKVNSLT